MIYRISILLSLFLLSGCASGGVTASNFNAASSKYVVTGAKFTELEIKAKIGEPVFKHGIRYQNAAKLLMSYKGNKESIIQNGSILIRIEDPSYLYSLMQTDSKRHYLYCGVYDDNLKIACFIDSDDDGTFESVKEAQGSRINPLSVYWVGSKPEALETPISYSRVENDNLAEDGEIWVQSNKKIVTKGDFAFYMGNGEDKILLSNDVSRLRVGNKASFGNITVEIIDIEGDEITYKATGPISTGLGFGMRKVITYGTR